MEGEDGEKEGKGNVVEIEGEKEKCDEKRRERKGRLEKREERGEKGK